MVIAMVYKPFRVLRKRFLQRIFVCAFIMTSGVAIVEYLFSPFTPFKYNRHIHVYNLSTTKTCPLTFSELAKNSTTKETREEIAEPPVPLSGLNVHTWSDICGTSVDVLRNWPHFPFFPDKRGTFISNFYRTHKPGTDDFGERCFGFIHPETSGVYKFAISSDDTSELWLSPSEDPAASEMIACVCDINFSAWTREGEYKKYPCQISKEITLHAGKKYYIEALMKQGFWAAHVAVYWAYGSSKSTFEIISSKYLTPFSGDRINDSIPLHAAKQTNISDQWKSDLYILNNLPVIDKGEYVGIIPICPYNPSFSGKKDVPLFPISLVNSHLSHVFPEDGTDMRAPSHWSQPNPVVDMTKVESVVDFVLRALRSRSFISRNYVLHKIYKVIQKPDPGNGDRFLVDLILRDGNTNQTFRLTEHVYQKKGNKDFCLPEGISWKRSATVYFIIPVKDQGKWVHHFIKQVTKASLLSGDKNFHIIIADFESKDIDMGIAFDTPLLRSRHTIIPLTGKFYKNLALNKAVEAVPNTDDIVFLFDLHIDVPADIMDNIRKNTIAGRIAYFPIVGRLFCGHSSHDHYGYWEGLGFGLLAIYKSDWNKFGGMTSEMSKYSWGGEDWELLRRVLKAQFEVERIKYPGLFHHHHSKLINSN